MAARMKEKYQKDVVKALMEEFKYSNLHQVPRIVKVVANMGLGEAVQNPKIIESGPPNSPRSPDESRSSTEPRRQSRPSSFARGCPSVFQ